MMGLLLGLQIAASFDLAGVYWVQGGVLWVAVQLVLSLDADRFGVLHLGDVWREHVRVWTMSFAELVGSMYRDCRRAE